MGGEGGLFREIVEHISHGVAVYRLADPDDPASMTVVYANPVCNRLTGVDLAGHVGRRVLELIPIAPERLRVYAEVCRTRQATDFGSMSYLDPRDGARVTFAVRAVPVLDDHVLVLFENLNELVRTREFLESIIENIPAMVFMKDARELRFERFNRAGEELLGLSRDQLIGKSDHDFFPADQADFFTAKDRDVLARRGVEDIPEEPIETPRGTRWLHTRKIPLLDETGAAAHLLGVSIDITEQRKVAELRRDLFAQLEAENRRVVEATRSKSEFLANMSHELRTPLNAIIGFSQLLHDGIVGKLDARQTEFIGDILDSGKHLLGLINDILDLAKVESGKLEFHPSTLNLCDVIEEVRNTLRVTASKKEITVTTQVAPELGPVTLDSVRLKQVLYNYLSNALKFTPSGGRVELRALPEPEQDARFRLEVEDSGIGIAPEDLARLFVEFQQLDGSATRKHGGTGLGLALVKRLVEAQGGSVGVHSTPGVGSRFSAVLPRQFAR